MVAANFFYFFVCRHGNDWLGNLSSTGSFKEMKVEMLRYCSQLWGGRCRIVQTHDSFKLAYIQVIAFPALCSSFHLFPSHHICLLVSLPTLLLSVQFSSVESGFISMSVYCVACNDNGAVATVEGTGIIENYLKLFNYYYFDDSFSLSLSPFLFFILSLHPRHLFFMALLCLTRESFGGTVTPTPRLGSPQGYFIGMGSGRRGSHCWSVLCSCSFVCVDKKNLHSLFPIHQPTSLHVKFTDKKLIDVAMVCCLTDTNAHSHSHTRRHTHTHMHTSTHIVLLTRASEYQSKHYIIVCLFCILYSGFLQIHSVIDTYAVITGDHIRIRRRRSRLK